MIYTSVYFQYATKEPRVLDEKIMCSPTKYQYNIQHYARFFDKMTIIGDSNPKQG